MFDKLEKANRRSEKAKQYWTIKNRLMMCNLVFNLVFFLMFIFTGWSAGLRDWLSHFQNNFFLLNTFYLTVFGAINFCLFLPFNFYEGFVLEHRFGLSRQTFRAWFMEAFKKTAIVAIIALIFTEVSYLFLLKFPQSWWFWTPVFYLLILIILTKLTPDILLPFFFRFHPLEAGPLRIQITGLLKRFNVVIREVYIIEFSKKTAKANAIIAGLGKAKYIFLSDTLVNQFSVDEAEIVFAHELGHLLRKDPFFLLTLRSFCVFVCFFCSNLFFRNLIFRFGFNGLSDIAALPILIIIFMLISLVLAPLKNYLSRFLEKQADDFAIKVTGNPKGFISMIRRLGENNLSDFSPSRLVEIFYYDHPPILKRMQSAQQYLENKA